MKFSNNGVRLWATYYGGSGEDMALTLNCDLASNLFIAGRTHSSNFPVQNAGTYFDNTLAGVTDAFILKFDNNGVRIWATYYGGSGNEYHQSPSRKNLAIDKCGTVYLAFETGSVDISTQPPCDGGYFDNTLDGTGDQFILRFSNMGDLLWASYIGGDGID